MTRENRRALRTLFVCLTCVGLGQAMLFAILPPAARELGLSPFQVSLIFVASATIWFFVSPRWGRYSDVVGRRLVILIGLLGFATSMVLLAATIQVGLSGTLPIVLIYPLMIASRCVFALLGSGTGPASQAYVADRTERGERTAAVAMLTAAFGLGQTIGPAWGAVFAAFGVVAPIYSAAGLAVASAAAIWLLLPEERDVHAHTATRQQPRLRFADRRFWPFLVIAAALQAVRATTTITLAFLLQDTLSLDAQRTAQFAGAGFVALALAGLLTQALIVQRLRPAASAMIRIGLGAGLAAFATFVSVRSFPGYVGALLLLGFSLGLVRPGTAAGASLAVTADEQGAVAGLTGSIGVVGNIFGPMLGTALYSFTPLAPYALNGLVMASALIFSLTNRQVRDMRG